MRLDPHLAPRAANYRPLTPVDFLERALEAYPERTAVIWRRKKWSYGELGGIVLKLADWLRQQGVVAGDVVSVMCPNRPEMLAAHYAVPMLGATLNAINIRLDHETVAYILGHAEARVILADPTCRPVAEAAAEEAGVPFDMLAEDGRDVGGGLALLDAPAAPPQDLTAQITDEWLPIGLNYTSGTTGRPKGVVLHHRGAYLNALGNVMALGFDARTVYLWTLPMFHCNGWCHTWAVTAAGGVHVCLDRVEPQLIFRAIAETGVTHMSCAPVVLYMLLHDPARQGRDPTRRVTVATGGAAPTSALIAQMEALGFDFIHLYGLTESYGPATGQILNAHQKSLNNDSKAELLARQGVRHPTSNRVRVVDEGGADVPADGATIGEITLHGNTIMAGYYRDAGASETAFKSDAFHTGDLAVMHPDGRIEIRDRAKDVIISGGENISSLEIESALHKHPAVMLAAVVAEPHPKWGETPCAFIEAKAGTVIDPEDLRAFCRAHLAHFKVPRRFVNCALPKTATGKIQKFRLREIARAHAADGES